MRNRRTKENRPPRARQSSTLPVHAVVEKYVKPFMEITKNGLPFTDKSMSDVDVILTASAAIDDFLRILIFTTFRKPVLSNSDLSRLFAGRGPLSSLADKLELASALLLFNTAIEDNIRLILSIRNRVAHSLVKLTFDDHEIKRYCDKFKFNSAATITNDTRERFILATGTTIAAFFVALKLQVRTAELVAQHNEQLQERTVTSIAEAYVEQGVNYERDELDRTIRTIISTNSSPEKGDVSGE